MEAARPFCPDFGQSSSRLTGKSQELLGCRWHRRSQLLYLGDILVRPNFGATAMEDVSQILCAIDRGDPHAAEQLLPLVYEELRKLAAQKLAHEKPGQTLQATALVHEAYLRLVAGAAGAPREQQWNSRGHFFGAAAEAMRRILVERARQKRSLKGGGGRVRQELPDIEQPGAGPDIDLLALNEALEKLEKQDRRKAELIKLRFFAGLTIEQAAQALGISESTADNDWAYARCWLRLEIEGQAPGEQR
jgi:RNA polymerase sigma factor (TIGR02999 family)